jgi:hypothetical protein
LRRAMVRPGRDKLSGWVEVDETYFGGLEEGKAGASHRLKGRRAANSRLTCAKRKRFERPTPAPKVTGPHSVFRTY